MLVYLILHYKNADVTERCINSLLLTEMQDAQLVVVDNASNNGSYEYLCEQFDDEKRIHFLQNKENLGYAAGNNVGFRYAKEQLHADWIVLLNNDVTIEQKDFQQKLFKMYAVHSFYVAGPDIVTPEGGSQNPFRDTCPERKEVRHRLRHDYIVLALMKIGLQQKLKKLLHYDGSIFLHNDCETMYDFRGVLHGSCLIFSPLFIQEFNGLYNDTFLYCEEEILCYILKHLGYTYSYLQELKVIHRHSVSMKREIKDADQRKMMEISRRIVSYKKFLKITKTNEDLGRYLR